MKKTLLALATVALGVASANAATVYFDKTDVDWAGVFGYSWSPDYAEELTTVEIDGHTLYFAELDNAEIIFRGAADWNHGQTENLPVVDGAVYGKSNVKPGATAAEANIVNGKYVANVIDPDVFKYQIRGQIFGDPNWSNQDLTENDGIWSYTGKVVPGSFGIRKVDGAGTQTDWIGGEAVVNEANKEYSFVTGLNSSTTLRGEYTIEYNPTAQTIKFIGEGGGDDPQPAEVFLAGTVNNWKTNDAAYKFTSTDGKNFTYEIASLEGEFKIVADGVWYGSSEDSIILDDTYELSSASGEGTNLILLDQAAHDLTLHFNIDTKEFKVSGTGGGLNNDDYKFYTMEVSFNWGDPISLEKAGNGVWECVTTVETGAFQIWIDGSFYGPTSEINETGTAYPIAAYAMNDCTLETAEYKVTIKESDMTVTLTPVGGPVPSDSKVYLAGEFNNWSGNTNEFTTTDNKIYTYEIAYLPGEFKVVVDGTWLGTSDTIELGEEYVLSDTGMGGNCVLADQTASGLTLTFDVDTKTLKVVAGGEVEEVITYALRGTIFDGEWNDRDMTEEAGKWTWKGNVIPGTFGIKKLTNGVQLPEGGWISASGTDINIAGEGDFQGTDFGGTNWVSTLDGSCSLIFDPETMILKVDDYTGVMEINMENGKVVFFDLQGNRVAEPANGLFIRVENGKAAKVVK